MRDPNERMLMGNLVKDSPMFDFVEQLAGRENQVNLKSEEEVKLEKKYKDLEKRKSQIENGADLDFGAGGHEGHSHGGFANELELQKYAKLSLKAQDLEVIRSSLGLLSDIEHNSETFEEM
jgi:hypothetical protein